MTTKISTNNDTGDITSNGGGIDLPATLPGSGATLITNASLQYVSQTAPPFMRNRIINGAQMINQRYVDAPVAPGSTTYVNDRWLCVNTLASGSFLAARCQGWSNYFDGTGDYVSATANAAFDPRTENFTIEAWVYNTTTDNVNQKTIASNRQAGGTNNGWVFVVNSNNTFGFVGWNAGAISISLTSTQTVSRNQWVHLAATKSGTTWTLFINGNADNSGTGTTIGTGSTFFAGRQNADYPARDWQGYISNLRIVKGTALYTSNFTPSTLPLVRVTNTALLICASETFQDKSSNNFTITAVGNTTVTSLSPFANVAPEGFTSGLMWSVLTPASAAAAERATIVQRLEGTSVSDLAWGTASAKAITISFWVRSPIAGNYCVSLANNGGSVSYVAEYSISMANTWEKKTVQVPGPTTGTFLTDTNVGFSLRFDLGSGANWTGSANSWQSGDFTRTTNQTNFVGTALASGVQSNNFIITGIQLELGSVATPFEFRPMQAEMALCQRYFARLATLTGSAVTFGNGVAGTATVAYVFIKYPVTLRANPTNITQSNTALYDTAFRPVTSVTGLYRGLNSAGMVLTASGGGMTINRAVIWCGNANAAAYVDLDAEL